MYKKLFGSADLAMIVTCFLWGLSSIFVKNAIGDTPETFRVFVFNGLRMPASSLLLFCAAMLNGDSMRLRHEHIILVAKVSFFGMFLHIVLALYGLNMTSVSNMGIIFATAPFFILVVSFVTGIEHPTKLLVFGILLGIFGVIFLNFEGGSFSFNPGDILIFISCLFWAIYTVFSKSILNVYSPLVATAWILLFASFYQIPLMIIQLPEQSWSTVTPENWINLIFATLASFVISNALFYFAIHRIGPIRVGLYSNLEPVFTLILANIIRGEIITLSKFIGLCVIFVGIGITKIPARAKPI